MSDAGGSRTATPPERSITTSTRAPIDLGTLWQLVEANDRASSVTAACVQMLRGDLGRVDLASPYVVALLSEHLSRADAPCDGLRTFAFELLTQLAPEAAARCFQDALAEAAVADAAPSALSHAMEGFLEGRGAVVPRSASAAAAAAGVAEPVPTGVARESRRKRQERLASLVAAQGRDAARCGNCDGVEAVVVLEVVPPALGGADVAGNLVPLCKTCRARVPRLRVGASAMARAAAAQRKNAGVPEALRRRKQLGLFGG